MCTNVWMRHAYHTWVAPSPRLNPVKCMAQALSSNAPTGTQQSQRGLQWTDPWVAGSSPRRRLTQSLGASVTRANEAALFKLAADDGAAAPVSAAPSPRQASSDGAAAAASASGEGTGGAGGSAKSGGGADGAGGGLVLVERCAVTAERSAALTESAYGTAGALRTFQYLTSRCVSSINAPHVCTWLLRF